LFLGGFIFLIVHALFTPRVSEPERLVAVASGRVLPFAGVVSDLLRAQLIFVGELHDQPLHRKAQLQVIRALHESDVPLAVGLEMFRSESQAQLDRWISGHTPLRTFLPAYYDNWRLPWAQYQDIFLYAREHGIPLVGLNVRQEVVAQVARTGFASLGPEQLQELPPVTCKVDEPYEEFIRRAMGMHGHDGISFTYFCEAQMLWDVAMAVNLLQFLEQNPERVVVVLAGSGHAWKRGIPEQIRQRSDVAMRVILPEIPDRLESATVSAEDTDYIWQGITQSI
jgi:uncharacterized iron-regulated protein